MTDLHPILVFVSLMGYVVLLIVGLTTHHSLRSQLRRRHPEIWDSLQSTSRFWVRPMANSLRFQRFLWTSRYVDLGDQRLNRLAASLKMTWLLYSFFFVLTCVLVAMAQATIGTTP